MRAVHLAAGTVALTLASGLASTQAQTTQPASTDYVTREEYDKLKAELDGVRQDMAAARQDQATRQKDIDDTLDSIEQDVKNNHGLIDDLQLGDTKFLLVGDASLGFVAQRKTDSTFDAVFSPLFLWQLNDRLLFEGSVDIEGSTNPDGTGTTNVTLTLANLTYLVNDYLYVGGGVFAVPFDQYHTHFDPPWINELPDDPLAFGARALGPTSETGVFAGGAVPIGSTKLEYNGYGTNGPNLIVSDPNAAGSLDFDDYTDLNNNKAVGERIGFLPIPQLDFGYSVQFSEPSPDKFEHTRAWLQGADVDYKAELDPILGTLELRAEWIWSNLSRATYDPTGSLGFGPLTFANNSNGGYVLAAYRPTKVNSKIIRSLEFVCRYDAIFMPADIPGGGDERRWTFGVDYWITPSVVLQTAYEIDEKQIGPDQNALLVQCGIGL